MQTETEVNWGLKLFADTNNTCGVSPNTVAVPIGGQQRRRDCGGDRGAHRRDGQRHQRQPHAHAGRGGCGRDVPPRG